MSDNPTYPIPQGQLGLTGPIVRPEPGTLPIRGDLAHIALATRFLVPHYVVPQTVEIAHGPAPVLLAQEEGSQILVMLENGDAFEAIDVTESWVWGALGPDGPSGYVVRSAFDF